MRFNGHWLECADGITRPVIDGGVLDPNGIVRTFPFLIDSGADATVLSYWAVDYLGTETEVTGPALQGFGGGSAPSVFITTSFWLLNTEGTPIRFGGRLRGRADPAGDDLCILGRDLLGHFAVVMDQPANIVCLLNAPHRFVIQEA